MKYVIVLLMTLCGYGVIAGLYYKFSNHCFTEIVYALRNGESVDEATMIKQNVMAERAVINLSDEWYPGLAGSISGVLLGMIYLIKYK